MSDNQIDSVADETAEDIAMPSELDVLRQQARVMGLKVSGNISVETLKAKIKEKLAADEAASQAAPEPVVEETAQAADPVVNQAPSEAPKPAVQTKMSLRQQLLAEQMKLVRLRIQNLDPKKAKWQGEVITVANEYLGTVKKFVPFGEATDDGYHVPFCIYTALKERTFLQIKVKKDKRTNTNVVESREVREFALEVLPQLTPEEIARLAASQAAAGGLD